MKIPIKIHSLCMLMFLKGQLCMSFLTCVCARPRVFVHARLCVSACECLCLCACLCLCLFLCVHRSVQL